MRHEVEEDLEGKEPDLLGNYGNYRKVELDIAGNV